LQIKFNTISSPFNDFVVFSLNFKGKVYLFTIFSLSFNVFFFSFFFPFFLKFVSMSLFPCSFGLISSC
jgi:hypothetical protein